MSVIVQRRSADGLHQILPPWTVPFPRDERYMAIFCAFLASSGLFVSGLAPALLVHAVLTASAIGELLVTVDTLLALRQPRAQVVELRIRPGR